MSQSLFSVFLRGLLLLLVLASQAAQAADWAKNFGLAGSNAQVLSTAVDSAGNSYVAGYFSGATLPVGATTLTRIGAQDAFVAKLDSSGTVLWAKNYGGSGANAWASGVAVDASGNVYLGGYFKTANLSAPALTKTGTQDVFALKLDSSGTTTWAKNFGGSVTNAWATGIAVDGSGNVYLGGYYQDGNFSTPSLTRIGARDGFAFKLDSGGTPTWAKSYGGSSGGPMVQVTGIAVDASGNVYLGGYFSGANLTTPALNLLTGSTAFAFKLDASGATTWAKNYGGGVGVSGATATRAWATAIAVDASGNVYLGGYFNNGSLATPALTWVGVGAQDAFAFKLDSSGATTWAKNYGGSGANAWASGIAVDASGNVYLGGYFRGANLTTPALTKIGTQDAFALKLNSSGATLWSQNHGGSGATVQTTAIAADASGNAYLGGYFSGANLAIPALSAIGSQDALVLTQNLPKPIVNSLSPASGSVAGGTVVTLTGYNFTGATGVKFGANSGTALTVNSGTSITVTTPASTTGAGAVDVIVTHAGGSNASGNGLFSYFDVPAQPAAPTVTFTGNVATVSFAAPAANGSAITGYTVSTSPAGGVDLDAGSTALSHRIVGLAAGTAYSFSVVASNAAGSSVASSGASASTVASYASENFGSLGANTQITATAVDSAGNTYVSGWFKGASLTLGATTLTRIGVQDVFVAKFNAAGTALWAKNYGGASTTAWATGIAVDGSGNVYLGGYYQDGNFSTPSLTRIGARDAFAFKLDSGGATTWAKSYGGSGAGAQATAIAVDASGNVYLGGFFDGANLTTPALALLGTGSTNSNARRTAFAFKLDASGATTWARNYGGGVVGDSVSTITTATAIAVDASGNVYLGGYFNNGSLATPALTRIGVGAQDAFAFKLDSSGATTWAKNYGGSGTNAWVSGIAVDASGNVYLGGYFDGANLTTPALTRIGTQDAFALKLNSSGATLWSQNHGGSGATVQANGIAVDGSGNVYLGGVFGGANLTAPALTKIGTQDAFALKLDGSGATTWSKNYGGSGATAQANGIAVNGSGNIYPGGYFSGANLTTPALTLIGSQDAFFLKSDTPPGAPSGVTASAGNGQATVTFTAPVASTVTGYTVTSNPAGGVDSNAGSTALSHTITGLANGTAYTFTVVASNSAGTSAASAASNAVTPSAPAPVVNYTAPAPTTTTVASGGSTTLGSLPVVSLGGATVTVPKDSSGGGKVTLDFENPKPTSLVFGEQTVSATPVGGPANFTVQTAQYQGKPVLVIQIGSGTASFTAPPGMPFMVLNGSTVSAGGKGAEVTGDAGKLVIRSGSVTLSADGSRFAAEATITAYAGEVIEKDASGKLRIRVGSASGSDGAVGDPLKPVDGLPAAVNLNGKLGRLNDTSPLDMLAAAYAQTNVTQNPDGTLGAMFHAVPVAIRIDAARADGVQGLEVARNGLVVRLLPLLAERAAFAAQIGEDASVAMDSNGVLNLTSQGRQYAGRAAVVATPVNAPAANGFSADAQGNLVWTHAGKAQVVYPAFQQLDKLHAALLALDAQATLTDNGDGSYSVTLKGQRYRFRPDYELLNVLTFPAAHRNESWWVDGGKVYLNHGNVTAQGFTVR